MIFKNELTFYPLIKKYCKIKTQNTTIEGKIVFESKEVLHIIEKNKKQEIIKKILKSSISELYIFDNEEQTFIQFNPKLLHGTLISRLKKMK